MVIQISFTHLGIMHMHTAAGICDVLVIALEDADICVRVRQLAADN